MSNRFVVFEGIDKSGKETQASNLAQRLSTCGVSVRSATFPDYETPIGGEIRAFLQEKQYMDPYVRHLLYTANRYELKEGIEESLRAGRFVVCDRYSLSGVVYGMAHGLGRRWLMDLERHLPQPHLTFLLDIPVEESLRRSQGAGDRYERDTELLKRCVELYREECEQSSDIILINGMREAGTVHDEIWEFVKRWFEL